MPAPVRNAPYGTRGSPRRLCLPVGQLPSYTHVTGRGPGHCGLVLRNDYGTKDAVVLHVACFAAAGGPADAAFDLTYATASPYE